MHFPRKRFGQHFLNDVTIVQRIVNALQPKEGQHLVEIGGGQGALTIPVLKIVKSLEVIELDRDLVPELERRNTGFGELIIHLGDVLKFDFYNIKTDERLLRVFGNLPYNISTPLVFHLLNYASIITDMLFMVQKEVADRMDANTESDSYSRLSVMVQYHYQVEQLFDVPASAFYPPPQVRSSIVRLIPYQEYPHKAHDYALFDSIVRHAFNQKRKTLRNSLKDIINDDIWMNIPIASNLRPENLSVKDFVLLSNTLSERA